MCMCMCVCVCVCVCEREERERKCSPVWEIERDGNLDLHTVWLRNTAEC